MQSATGLTTVQSKYGWFTSPVNVFGTCPHLISPCLIISEFVPEDADVGKGSQTFQSQISCQ